MFSGPKHWKESFPDCRESSQSPIDIRQSETVEDRRLGAFSHSLFRTLPASLNIWNNGHTCEFPWRVLQGFWCSLTVVCWDITGRRTNQRLPWAWVRILISQWTLQW